MKVLILSCNTGEGHNSAARAVKEVFDKEGIYCEIKDSLAYLSKKASSFICNWHVRLYKRAPLLFGLGYKAAEYTDKYERSMIYEIMAKGAKKLRKDILEQGYDTVICTHPFSAMTLTKAVKKYKLSLKSYFIATDYTCSPGVSASDLDYYIIPHESLKQDFIDHGIKEEKLFAGGIPVSMKLKSLKTSDISKEELGIDVNKKVLLVCGSMGCGPMKLIARRVSQKIKEDEFFVIICGNNKSLYKKLRTLEKEGQVRVLGYTKRLPDYMNAAHLLLTKPGGLSSSEAAANRLPMLLIDAVSGCETHNMRFWVDNNMALTCEKDQFGDYVRLILDNPKKIEAIRKKLGEEFKESSAQKIYDFVTKESMAHSK